MCVNEAGPLDPSGVEQQDGRLWGQPQAKPGWGFAFSWRILTWSMTRRSGLLWSPVFPHLPLPTAQLLRCKRIKEWSPEKSLWKGSQCWPRKELSTSNKAKSWPRRREEQLATHQPHPRLWTCLSFSFSRTPRWHVFSNWAILVEVYVHLFKENLLFLFLILSLSPRERVYLNAFVGGLK